MHTPSLFAELFSKINVVPTGTTSDLFLQLLSNWTSPYKCDQKNSVVCDRISCLYGLLYEHPQLATSTHLALEELFGVVVPEMFVHVAACMRAEHLVDYAEKNLVTHESMQNLDVPITWISGEKNGCFLPESTQTTCNLLQQNNPNQKYKVVVIPGYGHIDGILGQNAHNDVFPHIAKHLKLFKF